MKTCGECDNFVRYTDAVAYGACTAPIPMFAYGENNFVKSYQDAERCPCFTPREKDQAGTLNSGEE